MLSIYPACFFKENTGYSVIFPDLNWLSTCGETIEEAMYKAVECLAGYLYMCEQYGEKIPKASALFDIDAVSIAKELEINTTETITNMVSVDVNMYAKEHFEKSVKKTLTIPAWLNTAAIEQQLNFSQILQEALLSKLKMR